jgi:hypothetical protein
MCHVCFLIFWNFLFVFDILKFPYVSIYRFFSFTSALWYAMGLINLRFLFHQFWEMYLLLLQTFLLSIFMHFSFWKFYEGCLHLFLSYILLKSSSCFLLRFLYPLLILSRMLLNLIIQFCNSLIMYLYHL